MKKLVYVLIMFGILAGCKSDPYEGMPAVQATPPAQKTDPAPVTETPPPSPPPAQKPVAYTLEAPDVLNFKEGQKGEYQIRAIVPEPGKPVLQFLDLPTGMQFDEAQMKLVWTPSYTDADDPAHPNNENKVLVIEAQLSSSEDPVSVLSKKMVVVVQNTVHIGPTVPPTLPMAERRVLKLPAQLQEKIQQFQAPLGTIGHATKGQIVVFKNQANCESLLAYSAQESLALQCLNSETGEVETHVGFEISSDAQVIR